MSHSCWHGGLGGFDQGVGDGGGIAAGLRSDEEVVLAAQGDGPHGGIIVDLQDAVIKVGAHPRHSAKGIADSSGQRAFSRYSGQLGVQPSLQVVEGGFGLDLPYRGPLVGRQSSRHFLDGIESGDLSDGIVGDGRALGLVHAGELAPERAFVRHWFEDNGERPCRRPRGYPQSDTGL